MKRINSDTIFYASTKGGKPYENPFRRSIKQLRKGGARKQARTLVKAAKEAELEVRRLTAAMERVKVGS